MATRDRRDWVDARSAPNKSVNQQWGLHREASVEVRSSSTANTHDFVPLASALAPHNMNYAAWAVSGVKDGNSTATVSVVDLQSFNVIRTLAFEGPLWDIAWRDTFLICASSQGKITMTILGTENALPPQELTCPSVNDEELDLVELAEGRVWVGDEATRVRRVALHPRLATTSTLLSAQCSAVQIWDIANSDAPLLAKRVSKDLVLCAEWDPHNDKIFGVAGQRGTMKLLDARDGSSEYSCVWVKRQAHAAPIRAMKWNPCVPHWIATGGEEGLVKLWDLRYGARPVCTIHGHTGPVNSVDWNAAHPDLLVSGGSDRSLRVTSLTADNLAVIGSMSCGTLTDQITQVGCSGFSRDRCVAATANGVIHTARFGPGFFEPLTQQLSRFPVEERTSDERKLERLVYDRELEAALKLGVQLVDKHHMLKKSEEDLHEVIRLCSPVSPSSSSQWSDTHTPPPSTAFQKEALKHARRIPYNYPLPKEFPAGMQRRLNLLRLGMRVSKLARKKQHAKLIALQDTMLEEMDANFDLFDTSVLQNVVNVIFSKNFDQGINLALELAKRFNRADRWTDFIPIAASTAADSPAHDEAMSLLAQSLTKDTVGDQFELLRSFLRKQYSDRPPSDEEILGLLGTHVESFISLSAHVNRAYLNALFRQEAWDAFYILATELAHKAKGFEFETYVNNFMRDVVFPAFSNYLDSCQEPKAKLPAKRECIKKIASFDLNITLGADISYLTQLLPSVVKNVWKSIRKDIEKANRKEADKKKAVAFAKNMLADLEDIMAGKSFKTDAIEYEVKKVTDGLVGFISQ
ncbi:WD domain, Gbeta repeat domain containing protein [Acanthamoeba castellanii str. Neff]|uniref:WD domain, Gbeta repeat domain containing protein n=1 Tax=Acanthamoeba castellanii (strain ATCC 30010 / Neff) TaxID=1257118 RepID=L8H4I9_ACACF|nr:WD domain, Gbeta repeat domain containing protein [Acanthamoeba castellanii str. Neff]ELR20454.1 WD domain, Gbeta repeat domain containing protein [Acanthamoeba castellanii str. Neff]